MGGGGDKASRALAVTLPRLILITTSSSWDLGRMWHSRCPTSPFPSHKSTGPAKSCRITTQGDHNTRQVDSRQAGPGQTRLPEGHGDQGRGPAAVEDHSHPLCAAHPDPTSASGGIGIRPWSQEEGTGCPQQGDPIPGILEPLGPHGLYTGSTGRRRRGAGPGKNPQ